MSEEKATEISDTVVSGDVHTGDVHHHHYSDSPSIEENAPVMIGSVSTPVGGNPYGQVLMVGQPSGAAKVVGILIIIFAAFNIIFGGLGLLGAEWVAEIQGEDPNIDISDPDEYATYLKMASGIGLLLGIGFLMAGIWMTQFQSRGVQLALAIVAVSFVIDIVIASMYPQYGTGNMALDIGGGMFCSVICGLITAIPLMVANNGLDGSSLFSSNQSEIKDYGMQ